MDNRKQRSAPSVSVPNSFGPYHKKDLEAARAQLIRDLYKHASNPSGILTRVKLKCGILADRGGSFSGCEPHPVTNVSYESQSCDLMMHDGFPWKKKASVTEEDIQHEEEDENPEKEDKPYENFTIRINKQQGRRLIHQSDSKGRNSPQPSTSSVISNHLENSIGQQHSKKRKLDESDNCILISDGESDGIVVSDDEGLQIVNSVSNSKESIPKRLKTNENLLKIKTEVITIPDEKADITCYRCDICDLVKLEGSAIYKHLKSKDHYSASKYKGRDEHGNIIPVYMVHRRSHIYKEALYMRSLPVCTKCDKVFTDIHMCYIHQHYLHEPNEDIYSIGNVRYTVTVSVDLQLRCTQCKKQFPQLSNFIDHVKSVKHTNYPQPESDEALGLSCNMCDKPKMFSEFGSILRHFIKEHSASLTPLNMTVHYVEKTNKAKLMLPSIKKPDRVLLQDTLSILRRMLIETPSHVYDKKLKKLMATLKNRKRNKQSS